MQARRWFFELCMVQYRASCLCLAPTRHLGANKEYASKLIFYFIKKHTLFSTTKCRVGAANDVVASALRGFGGK